LAYFELLERLLGTDPMPASFAHTFWAYLPVALLLVVLSIALAPMLFGEGRFLGKVIAGWVRWIAVPVVAYLLAALLVGGYAFLLTRGASPAHEANADWGMLLVVMATVGILPLQLALILIPSQASAATKVALAPPDATGVAAATAAATAEAPSPATPSIWVVEASQGEPQFKVLVADVIAVEAADNYCKIHHLKDGRCKTKLLRMTLKEAEEALQKVIVANAPAAPIGFHRCHRSFLVNGALVEEVLGNSQAYRLRMRYLEEPVPVSRSFDVEVFKNTH
jgi:DNA-binding LytR/AlgR family response regulator